MAAEILASVHLSIPKHQRRLEHKVQNVQGDIAATLVAFYLSRTRHLFLRMSRDLHSNPYIGCHKDMGPRSRVTIIAGAQLGPNSG